VITNGYVTLAEFKDRISVSDLATNAGDDVVIEGMIESACRLFDQLSYRHFYSTTADETRYYKATSPGTIFIDDLLSVTSVKLDINDDRDWEVTLAATDYDLMPTNAVLNGEPYTWIQRAPLGAWSFPRSTKGIQIIGKFGYCITAPADVKDAILDITINRYQGRRGMGAQGVSLVSGAGVVITAKDVTEFAWKVIMARRKNWGG
jgi:hypothetical protein